MSILGQHRASMPLYIAPMPYSLTHSQTLEDRATQLLIKYKSGSLVTQCKNITFGNIFIESESLNIFTIVICMPVSNNSVSMSSFSDAVNINKYSDLHFSYIFYWTKALSLHWQYPSLTSLNDEAVYSVLLVDLSKSRMEVLNRC